MAGLDKEAVQVDSGSLLGRKSKPEGLGSGSLLLGESRSEGVCSSLLLG